MAYPVRLWTRLLAIDTIRRQPFFGKTNVKAGDKVRIVLRSFVAR